jgi:hypothetical protein
MGVPAEGNPRYLHKCDAVGEVRLVDPGRQKNRFAAAHAAAVDLTKPDGSGYHSDCHCRFRRESWQS